MSAPTFRFTGALDALPAGERRALVARGASPACDGTVRVRTAAILQRVRAEGDAALIELACELDGVALDALEVPRSRWHAALDALDPALRRALERAAENVAAAHRAQLPAAIEIETEPGVRVGRRPDPLARVGVYAPGGRAAYPSSVLMGAVPARVAGVGEVVLCSPPGADGLPSAVVLAAAELAGVDRVFAIGGAGAIAAMAYGTESVPRVDRVVGPGNAWVAEAKLQVSGGVTIDAPAGPSELLVIADERARPDAIAREVVAQAEHDPQAAVAVLTLGGDDVAGRIAAAVAEALATAPRRGVAAEALATRGALLSARVLDDALAFAGEYAAEHLLLAVADPDAALAGVRCTGTVFLGEASSVAFGDYMTGANHVLPTGGLARSWSGLSTHDFVRWTTWQLVEPAAAARLAADVATLAEAERLPGHAAAARAWVAPQAPPPMASPRAPALARPGYRHIPRYSPERTACPVDLSDNTSAWGPPRGASRALLAAAASADTVARYPSLDAEATIAAMAAYLGVGADQVVTGCGSDDILDSAIRAFGQPGDRLAYPDPSFSMIPVFARLNGLAPIAVPLTESFDVDADAMLATGARIIYLCSPNNPTGTALSRAAIERVVDRAQGLVILDGAYAEFAEEVGLDLLARSPRLLVTRTLSKAFGLAGLRVGYAAGAPEIVAEIAKSRGPYKVNALAERAARAALTEDLPWVRGVVAETVALRARLVAALAELGLAPLSSAANFVLVPVPDAAMIAGRMRTNGVAVRAFTALRGIGDALRIAVAPWPALETCLDALRDALAEAGR